jgi:hypothetical protein
VEPASQAESSPLDDTTIAGVFEVGLFCGVLRREDLIQWADAEIEQRAEPAEWLLDLSLSGNAHILDVVGLLRRASAPANSLAICRVLFALLPDVEGASPDKMAVLAHRIYRVTYWHLGPDWTNPLLREADKLHEDFNLALYALIGYSLEDACRQLRDFVRRFKDVETARRLWPVRWHSEE